MIEKKIQDMHRTIDEIQRCKVGLCLPEKAEETLNVFTIVDQLQTLLLGLEKVRPSVPELSVSETTHGLNSSPFCLCRQSRLCLSSSLSTRSWGLRQASRRCPSLRSQGPLQRTCRWVWRLRRADQHPYQSTHFETKNGRNGLNDARTSWTLLLFLFFSSFLLLSFHPFIHMTFPFTFSQFWGFWGWSCSSSHTLPKLWQANETLFFFFLFLNKQLPPYCPWPKYRRKTHLCNCLWNTCLCTLAGCRSQN